MTAARPTPAGGSSIAFNRTMIYVADLQRSVSFYSALGLEVTTADDEVVRLVDSRGTTLVLHVRDDAGQTATRGCRLYFAVPDADEMMERVGAHPAVEVLEPVRRMPWGRRHGYLLDPDGWEISLYEADSNGR